MAALGMNPAMQAAAMNQQGTNPAAGVLQQQYQQMLMMGANPMMMGNPMFMMQAMQNPQIIDKTKQNNTTLMNNRRCRTPKSCSR